MTMLDAGDSFHLLINLPINALISFLVWLNFGKYLPALLSRPCQGGTRKEISPQPIRCRRLKWSFTQRILEC